MASILPLLLEETPESENVDVTFSAVLEEGETLDSISITSHRENTGITVSGARFHGQYVDSFDLGPNGLLYRDTRDNSYHSVGGFDELPENPVNGHVYEFNAPSPLTTDYDYTVTLNYTYEDPLLPGMPEELEIIETFTQTVKGKWDAWGQQLRDYIAAGN